MPALLVALLVTLLAHSAAAIGEQQSSEPELGLAAPGALNSSTDATGKNATTATKDTLMTYFGSLLDLFTLKVTVIVVCAFSSLLVVCLVIRICRSGKKMRKTRKYDIITTPAERVEMAPLNEDNEDDEDSTVFDVKYRYR
ncbi:membrane protein FAM174B [Microcaecilia unicolor]|uniref:Membrane protein FAM174B-like n=1 Tax=Microcaecilia unicolor TaxID=1415580 RepID=A0A6P7X6T8_9AMPH|nr:membrane protein FAM174B-like [Microcaecilia unicolor]